MSADNTVASAGGGVAVSAACISNDFTGRHTAPPARPTRASDVVTADVDGGANSSTPPESMRVAPTPLRALLSPRPHNREDTVRKRCREVTTPAVEEKAPRRRLRGKSMATPADAAALSKSTAGGLPLLPGVAAALREHGRLLEEFERCERSSRSDGWESACLQAEQQVSERYEEFVAIVKALLPWADLTGFKEEAAGGYDVLLLNGVDADGADTVSEALERARCRNEVGRVRDALCAALAILACRREMCWLQAYDTEEPVRGYFAHALVSPESTIRITLAGQSRRPASLLVTKLMPISDAIDSMDSGGPLLYAPRGEGTKMCRQYALQQLVARTELWSTNDRQCVHELVPDEKIKGLFDTNASVLVIDVYAALAPRGIARADGLSAVAHAEFAALLMRASAENRAVLFQAGGGDPTALAEKVYLRPEFVKLGLRCGYLRWRPGPEESWARELPWKDRACIGMLIP